MSSCRFFRFVRILAVVGPVLAQSTLTAQRRDGTTLEVCAVRRGQPFVCADGTPRGVVGGVPPWRFWITSALLWWRLGPALLLLAVAFGVVRRWLARRRARRAT